MLEVTSSEEPDGRMRVAVDGEIDIVGIQELREQLPERATAGADLLLDLSAVTLLDSTGLAGLLQLSRDVDQGGGTIQTITPHGSEGRLVIDMAGVGELLGLQED